MTFDSRSGIYLITHTASGKGYVGSAASLAMRKGQHLRSLRAGTHHNPKLQNAWAKYGDGAFVFSVLEYVEDKAHLLAREQVWIDQLEVTSRTKGFNNAPTAGSLLGFKHSAETKARMAVSASKPKTAEHVANVARALKGRKMTPEQCEKMRMAKLGKKRAPHSEETKAKMSAASLGRKKSESHCANLAIAKLGKPWSAARRAAFEQSTEPPT